jgi:hypothetical protein
MLVSNQRDWTMTEQLGVKRERAAIVVEGLGVLQIALVLRKLARPRPPASLSPR